MEFFLFCATVFVLIASSVYLLGLLAPSRRNLPPGPLPLPLVGNLLSLGGPSPHSTLARFAERYGPVMTLRMGTVTTVVASTADAARDVLQRHDAAFSGRFLFDGTYTFAHYTHSMVWLPASSPRWRALRKVCSGELFAPHRLEVSQALRREKVQQLVSHVERLAARDGGGALVRVGRLAFTTALNLLSSTFFSTDLADLDDRGATGGGEFKDVLAELNFTVGLPNLSDFYPELAWLDPQGLRRRIEDLFRQLHVMIDAQIERRLRERAAAGGGEGETTKKKNFLDVLLDYRNTEDGKGFERQTLLSLFSDLFSAGTDTTSATVEWAMAELLLNPSCMARAREELDQVIGSKREIEESDIGRLKYIQAVVKEVFRLHPPAPFLLPHLAETATRVRGYTVPAGARLLVNVWAVGHDAEAWPEPERFLPERFLQNDKVVDFRGRDFELLPFGSGRRMCPGSPLAVRMVHLMIATLLHRFQWRLPVEVEKNGLDMTERLGLNLAMATPLQAIATPV